MELQVTNIERELDTQEANKSFRFWKTVCMTTQVIDSIKEQLIDTTKNNKVNRKQANLRQNHRHLDHGKIF